VVPTTCPNDVMEQFACAPRDKVRMTFNVLVSAAREEAARSAT
jgi:hypothetical protein